MKAKNKNFYQLIIFGSIWLLNIACIKEQKEDCNLKIEKIVVSVGSGNTYKKYIVIDSLFLKRNNPNDSHTAPIVGVKSFTYNQYQYQPFFLGEYSGKVLIVPYDWVIESEDILSLNMTHSIIKETIKLVTILGMENGECNLFVDKETDIIVKKDNRIPHE